MFHILLFIEFKFKHSILHSTRIYTYVLTPYPQLHTDATIHLIIYTHSYQSSSYLYKNWVKFKLSQHHPTNFHHCHSNYYRIPADDFQRPSHSACRNLATHPIYDIIILRGNLENRSIAHIIIIFIQEFRRELPRSVSRLLIQTQRAKSCNVVRNIQ